MPSNLNEVRSIEVAESIFKEIDNEIAQWTKNETLLQDFREFQNKFAEVLNIAKKYTFKDLIGNGYHSLTLFCLKLLLTIKKEKYFKKLKSVNEFKSLLKLLIFHLNVLISFEKSKNAKHLDDNGDDQNDFKALFIDDIGTGINILNQYHDNHIDHAKLYKSYPVFWCTKRSRLLYQLYIQAAVFSYHDFPKCFKTFVSPKLRAKSFVNIINNTTLKSPGALWSTLDTNVMRKLETNVFFRHKNAVGKNITINTKTTWRPVGKEGDVIQVNEERHPIKVRIIKHRTIKNKNGVLMFHAHGSGFVNTRPALHEVSDSNFHTLQCHLESLLSATQAIRFLL